METVKVPSELSIHFPGASLWSAASLVSVLRKGERLERLLFQVEANIFSCALFLLLPFCGGWGGVCLFFFLKI
jgi:hypothetical protein